MWSAVSGGLGRDPAVAPCGWSADQAPGTQSPLLSSSSAEHGRLPKVGQVRRARRITGLVTLVGLVTIGASTYLIIYSHQIYERIAPMLRAFERRNLIQQRARPQAPVDVIIYGYGRFGREIAHGLAAGGQEVLVVEWDPYARPEPDTADRVQIMYGDADDHEFPGSLPLDSARWVVSTIPHLDTSRTLARSLERWGYQGKVAVTAHSSSARKQLARDVEEGRIDRVLNPFEDAGQPTVRALLPAA